MSNRFVADFFGVLAAAAVLDEAQGARRREAASLRARLARLEGGYCAAPVPVTLGVGELLMAMRKSSFDGTRLEQVYNLSRAITASEASALLKAFSSDTSRLPAADYLYTLVTDKQNWAGACGAFDYDINRHEALKGRA